jgi:hypothetical protein
VWRPGVSSVDIPAVVLPGSIARPAEGGHQLGRRIGAPAQVAQPHAVRRKLAEDPRPRAHGILAHDHEDASHRLRGIVRGTGQQRLRSAAVAVDLAG